MDHHQNSRELEGKSSHDPMNKVVWVPHPIIVGAGPSGLAVAACLKSKGIHSLVLERSSCIASLWQLKTYDRLKLHLPKHFCQLPIMPFPQHFPNYPSRTQFLDYLHSYAERFEIKPVFDRKVSSAELAGGWWRVRTEEEGGGGVVEYASRWLVVATGENADEAVPFIEGMEEFGGESMMIHTSEYRNGEGYEGKKVCVVGCGNSGMEVALDLCNHNADPRLVVKGTVHILPREMLGMSTFGLSMWLLKWFNVRLVDRFLLTVSRFVIGDTGRFGIVRPGIGPLELKGLTGKTPVLDVGTLDKIRSGHIKIRPGIRRLLGPKFVEFEDGTTEIFDAIILATGYKSNVPSWLNENKMFSEKDGFPKQPFPNGWKGEHGLYAAGFAKRGLLGTSIDAKNIADDLEASWREEKKPCFF